MKKLFLMLITAVSFTSFAQNNPFSFDFDYSQFAYNQDSNYVEFYYSFNQSTLQKHSTDSADYVDAALKFVIVDTTKSDTLVNREWRIPHKIEDSLSEVNNSLIGAIGFGLPQGSYKVDVTGRDLNNQDSRKSITEYFHVAPFYKDTHDIKMSGIQLASRVIQDSKSTESVFYKNGMEVFPTPTSVFGQSQPVVFYYDEIYNITDNDTLKPLKFITQVYNSKKALVFNKSKSMTRHISSRVEVGSVPVNKYPTDTYTLILSVLDSAGNYGISSSKRFFVYNPDVASSDSIALSGGGMLSSQFAVMTGEELDDLFSKSRYVSTSQENKQYDKINSVEGKREFLYQFWKNRDSSPYTAKNENYEEYMERTAASNERFGALGKPGWKTDRGRIYITYGEPSEIERFPNQTDSKPYEIWHYNEIEGGVVFVFADVSGFSDYQLLHSTKRGELQDTNWAARIQTAQ